MSAIKPLPHPVVPHLSLLGEGPVWNAHTNTIAWVDILNGHIHEYTCTPATHRIIRLPEMIGSIALCVDNNWLVAQQSGLKLLDSKTGITTSFCHPEAGITGNRYNDGKCDPAGRFWIGSLSLKEQWKAGSLYMINADSSWIKQITQVSISNGMAWSADHTTFYYIDTPTAQVVAYDYDLATGRIANKRIVITIPEPEGYPDGMTIDSEGMLWIAHWDGWQVARWNPHNGKKLCHIPLPVARVTSCTFGGVDHQDLYITTASVGLSEQQRKEQPLAGALFVVNHCGYQGIRTNAFQIHQPQQSAQT